MASDPRWRFIVIAEDGMGAEKAAESWRLRGYKPETPVESERIEAHRKSLGSIRRRAHTNSRTAPRAAGSPNELSKRSPRQTKSDLYERWT